MLGVNATLKVLDLGGCRVEDEGAGYLANCLSSYNNFLRMYVWSSLFRYIHVHVYEHVLVHVPLVLEIKPPLIHVHSVLKLFYQSELSSDVNFCQEFPADLCATDLSNLHYTPKVLSHPTSL